MQMQGKSSQWTVWEKFVNFSFVSWVGSMWRNVVFVIGTYIVTWVAWKKEPTFPLHVFLNNPLIISSYLLVCDNKVCVVVKDGHLTCDCDLELTPLTQHLKGIERYCLKFWGGLWFFLSYGRGFLNSVPLLTYS